MKLEIIATTLNDAYNILKGKADRIELVSNINEGGLTPDIKLVNEITNNVDVPVYVMLRPHSKSFVYDENDITKMLNDLNLIKKTKAKGIVFGALTSNNEIDEKLLKLIIKNKGHLKLTFHRAIDVSNDILKSLEILTKYDIERVLTSGGKNTALEGINTITKMTKIANQNNISILAGAGLKKEVIKELLNKGTFNEVHLGSGVRFNYSNNEEINSTLISEIKEILPKK